MLRCAGRAAAERHVKEQTMTLLVMLKNYYTMQLLDAAVQCRLGGHVVVVLDAQHMPKLCATCMLLSKKPGKSHQLQQTLPVHLSA
jgi:hypothetical protein